MVSASISYRTPNTVYSIDCKQKESRFGGGEGKVLHYSTRLGIKITVLTRQLSRALHVRDSDAQPTAQNFRHDRQGERVEHDVVDGAHHEETADREATETRVPNDKVEHAHVDEDSDECRAVHECPHVP